ncbi:HprK-related kinase A [Ectothiorhodospira sp. BSL-9]|uniref:HprK-related kinase A n=1 Tax=Ectothiorhodospira sp. BSL-9 TaxID=1442136 RepID=UPI0007B42C1C|nr:HprK-related kinase A [Ectothiorhodospira sp. BSL-9]ANB02222.1 aldolase [Ectothiorhodospira sp. BSL-9]
MRISDLSLPETEQSLSTGQLKLVTGPFTTRIRSRIPSVAIGLKTLYGDFTLAPEDSFADFYCELRPPNSIRRYYNPQVLFLADGRSVFKPLAYYQAFPMLEWGMNWCIAMQAPQYLVFHAAALEKNGKALILPAPPGSGKSTLCAGLACRGWRLLTDESTLVDLETAQITGPARPVSLKNASIDVIQSFAPGASMGPICHDTLKGTVAHLRPPAESVARAGELAKPRWVVFPRYEANAETRLTPHPPGEAFMRLAGNSFNYAALGTIAFHRTADLMEQVEAFDFVYSRLEEAVQLFDEIAA